MSIRTNQNNNPFTKEGLDFGELNSTFDGLMPINTPVPWDKTPSWSQRSTGTADTDTADKLIDSGATFLADGVTVGMVIYNTTDSVFGIVDSIDSETQITIRADAQAGSAVTDVFPDGNETYVIYNALELPGNVYEMNGQTISDAESIHNGKTLPDMNGNQEFIRASDTSSTTGGSDTHTLTTAELPSHNHSVGGNSSQSGGTTSIFRIGQTNDTPGTTGLTGSGDAHNNIPTNREFVMVVRIK